MLRKCKEGIEWLEFALLQPYKVRHGVFLRRGEDPLENRSQLEKILELDRLCVVSQVHGKEVVFVENQEEHICLGDALITEKKGIGLCMRHADCQIAIFYDPRHHALAVVHCGWRGNVLNIYKEAIDKLEEYFNTKPQDLVVCVSPSLGPCHAEFIHYKKEFPPLFWQFQVRPNYFDLWEIARLQIEDLGVPKKQIEIASLCTYCEVDQFFSFRRDKTVGRNLTLAALL